MDWSDSWRSAFGIELRANAIGLASRGWPVLPGTYPADSLWVGGDGASMRGPEPVIQEWDVQVGTDVDHVASWWSGRPYSLLLATGSAVNAVEVGVELGRRAAVALRVTGSPTPIAATPNGRCFFLIEVGGQLRSALAEHPDVTLHGLGSWIPIPPTPYLHGVAHWRVKPEVCGWQLLESDVVQDALCEALQNQDVATRLAATGN